MGGTRDHPFKDEISQSQKMKWGEISRFLLYKSSKNKQTKVNLRIKGEKAGKQKIVF